MRSSCNDNRDISHNVRLLLLILVSWSTIAKSGKSSSPDLFLDLSYKHNLDANTLANVIEENIWGLDDERKRPEMVEVDLSCSIRDGKDFKQVVSSLLPNKKESEQEDNDTMTSSSSGIASSTVTTIHLMARMNNLEPAAMTDLLDTIMDQLEEKKQKLDHPMTSTAKEEKGKEAVIKSDETSLLSENNDDEDEINNGSPLKIDPWIVGSLDLGWNDVDPESGDTKTFFKALRRLVGNGTKCPKTLRLDRCGLGPAACRAIGKGIMTRFDPETTKTKGNNAKANNDSNKPNELTLHLGGNPGVGDSGAAALAAAIRTAVSSYSINNDEDEDESIDNNKSSAILDRLDLSACDIGDAGAEALALALESAPPGFCIRHLDLSNNRITDIGATALGRSLLSAADNNNSKVANKKKKNAATTSTISHNHYPTLQSIDLSNNIDIGDQAAIAIAAALEKGMVQDISIRSCNIRSDGASSFGKAVQNLVVEQTKKKNQQYSTAVVRIDLSGNPLGVLRGKSKSHGGKYSASRLKSQATATIASNMNFIGKRLRSGLKDVTGVDVSAAVFGSSLESDDEEDERMVGNGDNDELLCADDIVDPSKARCGVKAFANGFLDYSTSTIDDDIRSSKKKTEKYGQSLLKCELGMRRCFLDHGAADALAAVLVSSKEERQAGKVVFAMDTTLNPVLEEDMVEALRGDKTNDYHQDLLRDMADRHLEVVEALRIAQERAKEAADAAAARIKVEREMNNAWQYDDNNNNDREEYDIDFFDNQDNEDEYESGDGFKTGWDSDGNYEEYY